MTDTPLRCRDLAAGDIMLKVETSAWNFAGVTSRVIKLGQALVGSNNPGIVHAGIMFDSSFLIEAIGAGVSANDLRVQNRAYGYYVFRCRDAGIARGAGTCAKMMFDIHQRSRSMKYSVGGAVKSLFNFGSGRPVAPQAMDSLLDKVLEGRNQGFFCSQFVVYVYQFVAEQNGRQAASMFAYSDAKATPSVLAASLVRHSSFEQVGCLFPNER